MSGSFILWSTLLVVLGGNDAAVHQIVTTPFASKEACDNGIEILVKGRPGKEVQRMDGYVRTLVEVESATMVNRLQCIPTGFKGETPDK